VEDLTLKVEPGSNLLVTGNHWSVMLVERHLELFLFTSVAMLYFRFEALAIISAAPLCFLLLDFFGDLPALIFLLS